MTAIGSFELSNPVLVSIAEAINLAFPSILQGTGAGIVITLVNNFVESFKQLKDLATSELNTIGVDAS